MTSLAEIREQYPQYSDLSDEDLARGLHAKHYSDIPFEDFAQRVGLAQEPPPSTFDRISDAISGDDRVTPQIASLPDLVESGILAGEDPALAAAVTPALVTATDVNEVAQILSSNFPNIGTTFTQDAQGNAVPIVVNNRTGAASIINAPGISPQDGLNTGALGAAFTPATRATGAMGTALASMLTGGAIQAGQEASGGEFSKGEVALDTVLGGAGKLAENVAGTAFRAATGDATNDVVEAGREAGVDVLTSDVFPAGSFAGRTARETVEKIPLIGTGTVREAQQQQRANAVDLVVEKYGAPNYEQVIASLKAKKGRIKDAAGDVIERVGVDLDQRLDAVQPMRALEAIEDVERSLSKTNVIQDAQAKADLSTLVAALQRPQTFTSLRENRTAFRELVESVDARDRSQLMSAAKARLLRVERALKQDMEEIAKANLSPQEFSRWQKANAVYYREAQELKRSRLKSLLDNGDLTPEQARNMIFSNKPSEMRILHRSLDSGGRANVRAAIIHEIAETVSKRQAGNTPNAFVSEMAKRRPAIDVFFKGSEKRELVGFGKLLDHTRRAQDASVTTPTGQSVLALIGIGGAVSDLGATATVALTAATLGRLFESAPVRDALLRLGSIPRGSTGFEQAAASAQSILTATAQALTSEDSEGQTTE